MTKLSPLQIERLQYQPKLPSSLQSGVNSLELVEGAATQPDSAIVAIRVLFALIPAIFLIICIPFLLKYPITKEAHAEVLAKLQERRKENH